MSPRVGRGLGVATWNAVRPPRSETTLSSERFPEDGGIFETEFEEERPRVDRPRFSCPRTAHLPIVLRARAGRQFQGRLPVAAERTGLFLFRAVTFIKDEKFKARHVVQPLRRAARVCHRVGQPAGPSRARESEAQKRAQLLDRGDPLRLFQELKNLKTELNLDLLIFSFYITHYIYMC